MEKYLFNVGNPLVINWVGVHPRKIPETIFVIAQLSNVKQSLYLRKCKDQNLLIGSRKSLLHGSSPRHVFVWSRTSRVTFLSSWFRFRDLSNELSIILREIFHPLYIYLYLYYISYIANNQAQLVFQEFLKNFGMICLKMSCDPCTNRSAKKQLSDFCTWEPNRKFSVLNPVSGMESFKFHPQKFVFSKWTLSNEKKSYLRP